MPLPDFFVRGNRWSWCCRGMGAIVVPITIFHDPVTMSLRPVPGTTKG